MQNHRYYFETKPLGKRRGYRPPTSHSIHARHRQIQTLRTMIAEVDHSIMALDRSIQIEQELSRIDDRSHYAYPMAAKAMEKRRDNLKVTRDTLAQRLSSFTGSETN
jgi:hypothetical protein